MKAAQAPGVGGGLPIGGPNPGGHSPHQGMHGGKILFELLPVIDGFLNYYPSLTALPQ